MSGYKQCRSCGEPIESPHACCHFCGWNQSYRPTPKQKEGETMKECKRDKCEAEMSNNRKFCYECGFDQSKNPSEEPVLMLPIYNWETVAYVRGLFDAGVTRSSNSRREELIESEFPGGRAAIDAHLNTILSGKHAAYRHCDNALKGAGIDKDNAPWLKKKYREKVGCRKAVPTKDGVMMRQPGGSGLREDYLLSRDDLRGWLEASEEMDN